MIRRPPSFTLTATLFPYTSPFRSSSKPPHSICLATDLSHGCDRALDRAVQLAQQWSAKLLVVHAVEKEVDESYSLHSIYDVPSWRRPADPVRAVRDRLYQDLLHEGHGLDIDIHVETGDPFEIIFREAARELGSAT